MRRVFWFLILTSLSCTEDSDLIVARTNEEFIEYVERFVDEASKRELKEITPEVLNETIENLVIDFDYHLEYYCGYATSASRNAPRVIISRRTNCWSARSDADKEILIFHELGHAILQRSHMNTKLANGDYKSMMFDGNQFGLYELGSEKRSYYLNELFNRNTPSPNWAD